MGRVCHTALMKSILITGARGGIGSAISKLQRQEGHRVLETDHADADVASYDAVQALEKKILSEVSSIDWLICAHGFIDDETTLEKQTPENIRSTFDVNILSIIYIAQRFLPHLRDGGGMLALSSTAGLIANGNYAAYSASKAAVNSFMQGLARNRPAHRFFSVCPGPTETSMLKKTGRSGGQDPEDVAQLVSDIIAGTEPSESGDIWMIRGGERSLVQSLS